MTSYRFVNQRALFAAALIMNDFRVFLTRHTRKFMYWDEQLQKFCAVQDTICQFAFFFFFVFKTELLCYRSEGLKFAQGISLFAWMDIYLLPADAFVIHLFVDLCVA